MHMTGIFDVNPLRNPWAGANQARLRLRPRNATL